MSPDGNPVDPGQVRHDEKSIIKHQVDFNNGRQQALLRLAKAGPDPNLICIPPPVAVAEPPTAKLCSAARRTVQHSSMRCALRARVPKETSIRIQIRRTGLFYLLCVANA
jgi:hypothetical protein